MKIDRTSVSVQNRDLIDSVVIHQREYDRGGRILSDDLRCPIRQSAETGIKDMPRKECASNIAISHGPSESSIVVDHEEDVACPPRHRDKGFAETSVGSDQQIFDRSHSSLLAVIQYQTSGIEER